MSATAPDGVRNAADRLGITTGAVVQEIGWDDDVDETVRAAVSERTGQDLVDEDYEDVVDVVLLWWRDEDGDLVDALVDALAPLGAGGVVWVITPKTGRPGHVAPSEIAEAAPTAGLAQTSTVSVATDWSAVRLVPRRASGKPR